MEVLFSQESEALSDTLPVKEPRSFYLQDIYANWGNNTINESTISEENITSLSEFFVIPMNPDTFNRGDVSYVNRYRLTNYSIGTSFIIQPKKFDSRISFRWDNQLNYASGSYGVFNAAHADTLFTDIENNNGIQTIRDSILSSYVGITDKYESINFGTNFMLNFKYFTTLDMYAGIGGNFGIGNHQYQIYQTTISEIHQRENTEWTLENFDEIDNFRVNTEWNSVMNYGFYIPLGVNWQTAHYHKFFSHLMVSFDLRYGLRFIQLEDNLEQYSYRYLGLGLKWRL